MGARKQKRRVKYDEYTLADMPEKSIFLERQKPQIARLYDRMNETVDRILAACERGAEAEVLSEGRALFELYMRSARIGGDGMPDEGHRDLEEQAIARLLDAVHASDGAAAMRCAAEIPEARDKMDERLLELFRQEAM